MASAGVLAFLGGAPFGLATVSGETAPLVVGAVVVAGALAGYVGSRRLRVVHLEARFPDLPRGLEGLRIAQVSDLHVGPHTPSRHLRRILRAVQEARPDLIAITGDQVDDYARDVETFARAFEAFDAPLGVYAIAGNHDVYAGWPQVRAGLEGMGVTVLVNEARPLDRGGDRFWIAGTGDPAGIGRPWNAGGDAAPDIGRTLSRVPPGAFTIALAHNPALWPHLAERGVRLTLSGHTHYGPDLDSPSGLEPRVDVPRPRDGRVSTGTLAALHQPGDQLLGPAAAHRRAAGSHHRDAAPFTSGAGRRHRRVIESAAGASPT